jgi:hypothetical protein
MTIEQTVTIPADYRIFIDLPRSVPSGVKASIKINISTSDSLDEVRQLLKVGF